MSSSPLKEPLNVKLRCKSWPQVQHLYERDIKNGRLFLKASKPPPLHTRFEITLGLPSGSSVLLRGRVIEQVPEGGRGPGVTLVLDKLPTNAQWLLESALKTAAKASKLDGDADATSDDAPSMTDGEDVAEAEDALVEQLRAEHAALAKLNSFQLLDVGYDATEEQIRAAFAALTKRYHPDRFARYQSATVRDVGAEVYLLVRNAYKELITAESRLRALATVGQASAPVAPASAQTNPVRRTTTPPPIPRPTTPPPIARTTTPPPVARTTTPPPVAGAETPAPESGPIDKLLREHRYSEALKLAKAAAVRDDGNKARAMVELCEGLRALAEGDRMEAAERLEVVLELIPDNEHAIRGLAEIRRRVTEERKGFLGRLLNKKD